MTGRTRDYLADLANKKGITLPGMQEASQAQASEKINELKLLPDKDFRGIDENDVAEVNAMIKKVNREIVKWTFEE